MFFLPLSFKHRERETEIYLKRLYRRRPQHQQKFLKKEKKRVNIRKE